MEHQLLEDGGEAVVLAVEEDKIGVDQTMFGEVCVSI